MSFDLEPEDVIRRTELHQRYGGRRQGGISPSSKEKAVFLITAPERGAKYGYIYDGFSPKDGFYYYTGEGQVGDQQMKQGNRAIRDHEAEDRELHLFEAHGTHLRYVGEFRYVDDRQADAKDINGDDRKVIVFRLEQLSGGQPVPTRGRLDRFGDQTVKEVPVEQFLTEGMVIDGDREPYEAERREQRLVRALAARLEQQGHEVCRLQFRPEGEEAPLFSDLYDKDTRTLYEAKGTVTRAAIRMAIGQLADYSRLIDAPVTRAILLPEKPRPDLLRLAESQDIDVVWIDTSGREATPVAEFDPVVA